MPDNPSMLLFNTTLFLFTILSLPLASRQGITGTFGWVISVVVSLRPMYTLFAFSRLDLFLILLIPARSFDRAAA